MKINKILSPLKLSKAHIRNWNLVRSQDVTQWDKAPQAPGFGHLESWLSVIGSPL